MEKMENRVSYDLLTEKQIYQMFTYENINTLIEVFEKLKKINNEPFIHAAIMAILFSGDTINLSIFLLHNEEYLKNIKFERKIYPCDMYKIIKKNKITGKLTHKYIDICARYICIPHIGYFIMVCKIIKSMKILLDKYDELNNINWGNTWVYFGKKSFISDGVDHKYIGNILYSCVRINIVELIADHKIIEEKKEYLNYLNSEESEFKFLT